MRTKVIAFHGRPGNARMLRRDMGDPPWVDQYFAGHDIDQAANLINCQERVILIGYSFGGDLIARLSVEHSQQIAGVVLYESPLLSPITPGGWFPAMMIWNGCGRRTRPASKRSAKEWRSSGRIVHTAIGTGGHIKFTWRWPFVGHAWDKSLNEKIETFIRFCRLGRRERPEVG